MRPFLRRGATLVIRARGGYILDAASTLMAIIEELQKADSRGIPGCTIEFVNVDDPLADYYRACWRELEMMSQIVVMDNASLSEIIVHSDGAWTEYARSTELVQALYTGYYKQHCPKYFPKFQIKFDTIVRKQTFYKPGRGANVNALDNDGHNRLHVALKEDIDECLMECVRLL